MLDFIIKYFSPDDSGGSGEAAAAAIENDDLFDYGSDAESNKRTLDGIEADNANDTEGKPFKQSDGSDDEIPEESFESLIKGRYKKDYQDSIQRVINKRFKESKELEGKMKKLQPLIGAAAVKYNVDPNDLDAILAAVEKDNSFYEDRAIESGFGDAAAYKKYVTEQQELANYRAADQKRKNELEVDERRRQLIDGWRRESEDVKKSIPGFDFDKEWIGNEKFRYLVNSGFGVKNAYDMVHAADRIEAAEKAAAEKARKEYEREIRANGYRPSESGLGGQAAIRTKKTVEDMSLNDIERIFDEAKRGKKILIE